MLVHQVVLSVLVALLLVLPVPFFSAGEAAGQHAGADRTPEIGDARASSARTDARRRKERAASRKSEQIIIDGMIRKGDTAQSILVPHVGRSVFRKIMTASKRVYDLSNMKRNHGYRLVCSSQKKFVSFEYHIDQRNRLIVSQDKNGIRAERKSIPYECKLSVIRGVIRSSLFKSLEDAGEKGTLGVRMANIFSSEINFVQDIQAGDSYTIVVEKRYRNGVFLGYGRILGSRFTNGGKTYTGYLYEQSDGCSSYFNASGKCLQRMFLKAPLRSCRITSGYTMRRRHPIFRDIRPHQGIDYAAPAGTPVNAIGDGVVAFAGWQGGFGRTVVIRHAGGLESMYAHLQGYERKIKKGAKVQQGQVLGYVGSSGISTGPHLDFRIRRNGSFVNPANLSNLRHAPISARNRRAFARRKAFVDSIINGKFDFSRYRSDMIQ